MFAQDYLGYAERELDSFLASQPDCKDNIHLINCVAHLKRAVDCQIDTFLYVLNLHKSFSKKNLRFDKKLEFLKAAGIFSSRSLTRLNNIRNKMEHDYEIPKTEDIQVYFDLVSAFVAILQNAIMMFTSSYEIDFSVNRFESGWRDRFSIHYSFEEVVISASWQLGESTEEIKVDMTDPEEFAFFCKVLLLVQQLSSFASNEYITMQLR